MLIENGLTGISRGSCVRSEKGRSGGGATCRSGCGCGVESERTFEGSSITGSSSVPKKSGQSPSGPFPENSRELDCD